MKKIINRKTYNTDTAKQVKKLTFGEFGDPNGYEETLMQSARGLFFIYGVGGEESKYSEETILPLTEKEAQSWMKNSDHIPHVSENS